MQTGQNGSPTNGGLAESFDGAVDLFRRGALGEAGERCRVILKEWPNHAAALNLLGVLAARSGDAATAVELIGLAVHTDPRNAEFLTNLGLAYREANELDRAEETLRAALELAPGNGHILHNLSLTLSLMGRDLEELQTLWTWVQHRPDDQAAWISFTDAFAMANFSRASDIPVLREVLRTCFLKDGIEHQRLARAAAHLLRQHQPVGELLDLASQRAEAPLAEALRNPKSLESLSDPLLLAALGRVALPDPGMEILLTGVRRALLEAALAATLDDGPALSRSELIFALARHCYLNGYVFFVTDEERDMVESLALGLADKGVASDPSHREAIGVLASYFPLVAWDQIAEVVSLGTSHVSESFTAILEQQIAEPLEELELIGTIRSIGAAQGAVSQAVQEQYEESPYPRWRSINLRDPQPVGVVMAGLFPDAELELDRRFDAPRLLIAGCGTGRQVVETHRRFQGVHITGVDLSASSLAYALRKVNEYGCPNVELLQADILTLADWTERFQIVECAGVLHHMEDPVAGWRILTDLLEVGGLMRIALYSELARRPVVDVRYWIAEQGYGSLDDDIRMCRRELIGDALDGRQNPVLTWRDFYLLDECRDLLFHVQEHRFTLPDIQEIVRDLGLELLGFELPAKIRRDFRKMFPEPGSERSLDRWHEYEVANPGTFTAMYQFWLTKPA